MNPALVRVGYVRKAHRFAGAVRIEVDEGFTDQVQSAAFLFIEIEGSKIPFAVNRFEKKQALIVHFEQVSFPEDTDRMVGNSLFVEETVLSNDRNGGESGNDLAGLQYLLDYLVIEEEIGQIGSIRKIEQYPGQIMLTIASPKQELLVPFVDNFIVKINKTEKQLLMRLPDGLV